MLSYPEFTETEYQQFKLFLEQATGILLGDTKHYLITSRLNKLMRELGFATASDLLSALKEPHAKSLKTAVIDAMTTNETSWFRDNHPFVLLEKHILPVLENCPDNALRIWSAACSTGQEAYGLSMLITEHCRKKPKSSLNRAKIIATDISTTALAQAQQGIFNDLAAVKGLSTDRQHQFFEMVDGQRHVKSIIKQRIEFKAHNLLERYSSLGRFQLIFCRNVLIYFSSERKRDVLKRMAAALNPGGYLVLGASETIMGYSDDFEMVRYPEGVIYRKR